MELVLLVLIITIIILAIYLLLKIVNQTKANSSQIDQQLLDEMRQLQDATNNSRYQSAMLSEQVNHIENKLLERLSSFQTEIIKDQNEFQRQFSQDLSNDFRTLNERIENRLDIMNERVEQRLENSLKKTNETFESVISRLVIIDEAQKKIESLSTNIVSLQDVLTDKKARGLFGEAQLHQLLVSVFGENSKNVFAEQVKLSNSTIVDAVVYAPQPTGMLSIDSKFPLENYRRLTDTNLSDIERDNALKLFKADVKKHIDAIASKYIITNETASSAIMFLPAEAIFSYLHAYLADVVAYANSKSVWITSPTTLFATLTTLQIVMKNIERDKYTKVIQHELELLSEEFVRYQTRWSKLANDLDKVTKDVKDINTTSNKIERKFQKIAAVEFEDQPQLSEGE